MAPTGSRNRGTILTFNNSIQVVSNFSSSVAEHLAAIDNLEPKRGGNALYKAIGEAVSRLRYPVDHKAIVVVTDSSNDAGLFSVDEIIRQVKEAGAPLYIIDFGDPARLEPLKDKVQLTGGQYFGLTNADQIETTLLKLSRLLGQGYRISYRSRLKADNEKHELSILVKHESGQARDQGEFLAVPDRVIFTLSELVDGMTVGGIVPLSVQVTTAAPITSVEYLLNGNSLVKITEPPHRFDVDTIDSSEYPTGTHTISVRVEDSLGQQAEDSFRINFLPAAEPPRLGWPGWITITGLISLIAILVGSVIIRKRVRGSTKVTSDISNP